ncbi:putative E3 ubiquitin-protein ligase [Apostichopus japonicus]|uniref:Putative E3 ubiquitin-protein ligase n=1 Tax=Stichopus japonicus TaxID=307972 RepID=A0A2G8LRU6_STIJA|nr:putative E3 ubiquitin-protein ligase [Apostichopus japonicus]
MDAQMHLQEVQEQNHQLSLFIAIMRVPPLLILDGICGLRIDMSMFGAQNWLLQTLIILSGVVGSIIVFFLPAKALRSLYQVALALAALVTSMWWNNVFIAKIDEKRSSSEWTSVFQLRSTNSTTFYGDIVFSLDFTLYLCVQTLYAFLFVMLGAKSYWLRNGNLLYHVVWFSIPVVFRIFVEGIYDLDGEASEDAKNQVGHIVYIVKITALFEPVVNLTISMVGKALWLLFRISRFIRVCTGIVKQLGLTIFLESEWTRLQVPKVLRIFFACRFLLHILDFPTEAFSGSGDDTSKHLAAASEEVAAHVCDTFIAVLGISAILSPVASFMADLSRKFIGGHEGETEHVGTMTSILFFILALQTGLPSLDRTKRVARLYRNISLLATAHLHFIHNILHPVLMQLSTSVVTPLQRHVRALAAALMLLILPALCIWYWWSVLTISTWLLAVTAFCVELIVKVMVSLIVYALFMYDTFSQSQWESLDDYVYYIKAIGSTFEFLSGIFLFINGFWILVFESGGIIRAAMMCIHAYFNIFQVGKDGWKKFYLRRQAVQKINSLPEATPEQLRRVQDVCAICYQELTTTARITPCQHFFHGACLRKWLYMQDSCPLCHQVIMQVEEDTSSPTQGQEEEVPEHQDHPNQFLVQDAR